VSLQGTIVLQLQNESVVNNANSTDQALKRVQNSANQTGKEIEFSAKRAGLAMTGLVTNVTSAVFAYKNLGDMQLNVSKAAAKLDEKQDKVNKLIAEGKTNTDDYRDAIRDLGIAQENYNQNLDKVQEAQIMFALNLGTMAVTTIPAVITAMKGLNLATLSFTNILNTIRSHPVFLVVTAGILAWEFGISKLIKNYNGLDLSIQGNMEKLADHMFTTDQATTSMENYGNAINDVGSSARSTTKDMEQFGRSVDLAGVKIEQVKKNNDEIIGIISDSYSVMGSLLSVADALNDQATKTKLIQIQREWERMTLARNKAFEDEKNAIKFGGIEFIDALHERNFTARGMTTAQAQRLSKLSATISNFFRDIVANARTGAGNLRTAGLHGNIGSLGGITQAQTSGMINGGRTGSTRRVSGSERARRGRSRGGNRARNRDRLLQQRQADNDAIFLIHRAIQEEYKQYGFDIEIPQLLNAYTDDLTEPFLANYRNQVDRYNNQVRLADAMLFNQSSRLGLSTESLKTMYMTTQGRNDLEGMRLFKDLAALA